MIKHSFTEKIISQIELHTGIDGEELLNSSQLLEYINIKTKSANRGSKSRGSFANLYAIYVLVEDYIKVVYNNNGDYSKYEGAVFSDLFRRQRELPFGTKLQNHALNHRLNEEFHKYFPASEQSIILRDIPSSRYWINKNLIEFSYAGKTIDIGKTLIGIIDEYINAKRDAFEIFIKACEDIKTIGDGNRESVFSFVLGLLEPNVDARLFEIVSYAILKYYYYNKIIFWGYSRDKLTEENLKLYKTGRTNANDGGIDFVMRPLGYFFQVTESLDVKKYFLDIDKLEHYPIRFVIKTTDSRDDIYKLLKKGAMTQYGIEKIVDRYMQSIEEVVNIPQLVLYFNEAVKNNYLEAMLEEILIQSKVEFNYSSALDEESGDEEID